MLIFIHFSENVGKVIKQFMCISWGIIVDARLLPNGGVVVQAHSPASNIPGSGAVYEKQIGADGKTQQFTKTTYAPDGGIVHVKDKVSGGVFQVSGRIESKKLSQEL